MGKIKINNQDYGQIAITNEQDTAKLEGIIDRSITSVNSKVSTVGTYSFYNCNSLISANLENCTNIERYAFCKSALNLVSIPNCTNIDFYAFSDCLSLSEIDLPKVETMGGGVFQNSAISSISCPKLEEIPSYAFKNCSNLTNATFDSFPNVTLINHDAFAKCTSLQSVNLPKVTKIDYSGFNDCTSLTSVNLPEVTTMPVPYNGAFYGAFSSCTSLTSVNLPKLTAINKWTFSGCTSLISINFPEVTTIEGIAFQGSNIEIADFAKLTDLQMYAFAYCAKLKTLIIRTPTVCTLGSFETFRDSPFANGKSGGTLYVPQALISDYQNATNWQTVLSYPNNQIKPIEGSIYEE